MPTKEDLVARVRGASVLFVSGGNPSYLAEVLTGHAAVDGDPFSAWTKASLTRAAARGSPASPRGRTTATRKIFDRIWQQGLAATSPGVLFAPHWDIVDSWIPGARGFIEAATPPGGVLVALDEDTAMLGDGAAWSVRGRQGIHVLRDAPGPRDGAAARGEVGEASWSTYRAGSLVRPHAVRLRSPAPPARWVASMAPMAGPEGTLTRDDPIEVRAPEIIRRLSEAYPDAHVALEFSNPLEILVATILSAQCTDERVNMVTKDALPQVPASRGLPRGPGRRAEGGHQTDRLLQPEGHVDP